MVKTVLAVKHQGLRDFIIQRLSAIYMALATFVLLGFFVAHPNLSFAQWHELFVHQWVKVAAILFIFLLLHHTWVGVWTIFTDYVKFPVLRIVLNTLVIFMLLACFIWGVMILWSV